MSEESAFWGEARSVTGRSWLDRGRANTARFNAAHPPAPPDVTVPDEVDYTMDMRSYAEQRAALGIRTATSDFAKVDESNESGFPSAGDRSFTKEQRTQLGLATTHDWAVQPGAPRGIPADCLPESLAGIKGRGTIRTTNQNT